MADGLIDRLVPYCFGVCNDDPNSPGFEDAKTRVVELEDVRDLLRSDETRDALAKALYESFEGNPPATTTWTLYYEDADAVIRVFTGEAGDE